MNYGYLMFSDLINVLLQKHIICVYYGIKDIVSIDIITFVLKKLPLEVKPLMFVLTAVNAQKSDRRFELSLIPNQN